jgi:hypothetical protein
LGIKHPKVVELSQYFLSYIYVDSFLNRSYLALNTATETWLSIVI